MLDEDFRLLFTTLSLLELLEFKNAAERCFSSAFKGKLTEKKNKTGHGSNSSLIFSDLILNRGSPDNFKMALE